MESEAKLIERIFDKEVYNENLKPTEEPGVIIEVKLDLSIDQILDLKIIEESLVSRLVVKQRWPGVS